MGHVSTKFISASKLSNQLPEVLTHLGLGEIYNLLRYNDIPAEINVILFFKN